MQRFGLIMQLTLVALVCGGSAARSVKYGSAGRARVLVQDTVWTIGVLDGQSHEVLGRVEDLAVDQSGRLVLLDRYTLVLSWFTPTGSFLGSAGRAGGGPGELRNPVALAIDGHGRAHVWDSALRRISVFELDEDNPRLIATRNLELNAHDMCIIDDRYYFLAPGENALILTTSLDGHDIRSFGDAQATIAPELAAHAELIKDLQQRGRLVCTNAGAGMIVVVREQTPVITAYAATGMKIWEDSIRNYHQRRWEVAAGGRRIQLAADPLSGTAHTMRFAGVVGRDSLAVSLSEADMSGGRVGFEIRIISLKSGTELDRMEAAFALSGSQHGYVYAVRDLPFPQVRIGRSVHETVR